MADDPRRRTSTSLAWQALTQARSVTGPTGTAGPLGPTGPATTDRTVFSVLNYGAIGDGAHPVQDSAAILAATAAASAVGGTVYFPAAIAPGFSYSLNTNLTTNVPFVFAYGAIIDTTVATPSVTLTLNAGYEAGTYQVFGPLIHIALRFWTMDLIYLEHFGAKVLTDPRTGTNDSTAAIRKVFASLSGAYYPPPGPVSTPGLYNAVTISLLGIYGISDEIVVHPGGYNFESGGPGLTGSGFKWVGPDVIANATKAMLRLVGSQWAEIDGMIFIGLPTLVDANRLYAAIAITSDNSSPLGELARRTIIRRVVIGDVVGYFNLGGEGEFGNQFQNGVITDGADANDDFHVFDTVSVAGADYSFTIAHSQNVDVQMRNCSAGSPTQSAVWHQHGGELFIDGLYVYNLQNGASWFKLGPNAPEGAPNVRWTIRNLGGEGNIPHGGPLIDNSASDFTTCIFADFTRCEIVLSSASTPIIATPTPSFALSFTDSELVGAFILNQDVPVRSSLTFIGCRSMENVYVQNTTSYALLDLEMINCWAQQFVASAAAFTAVGRYMGSFNIKRTLGYLPVALSLADTSLYAITSTICDRVGIGNSGFGFESQLTYKSYRATTLAQLTQTFTGAFPAGSIIFGCQVATLQAGNYLANSNDPIFSRIFIGTAGDSASFRHYGSLSGNAFFTPSVNTDGFAPTGTQAAKNVVLTGGWEATGATWTWAGHNINLSSAFFNAGMVGNTILFTDGALAGVETVVTAFVDASNLTVLDSNAGSGHAVQFINFIADVPLLIAPLYLQSASNDSVFATGSRLNFLYAEPVTVT